jgi:agmatinase
MPLFEFGWPMVRRDLTWLSEGLPTFMNTPVARKPTDLRGADAAFLGIPYISLWAGFDNDVAPRNVRTASAKYLGGYLPELDIDVFRHVKLVDYGDVLIHPHDMKQSMDNVVAKVSEVVEAGCIPITVGGNAPCAGYSVFEAIASHTGGRLGIVNLDGHGDNRDDLGDEPNSSNWVWVMLNKLGKVAPKNHVQIGMRGPNNREGRRKWLESTGAHLYTHRQIKEKGIDKVTEEAIAAASQGTDGIWLAIDLDVLDHASTPDWVLSDPLGLATEDVLTIARAVGQHKLKGVSFMMVPGQSATVLWITIWTILYTLAGVAATRQ